MRKGIQWTLAAVVLLLGVGVFLLRGRHADAPVSVEPEVLGRWSLVVSDGTDPWTVGMQPPDALLNRLFADASRRAGRSLIRPSHPALPLVLRSESDEGLQGVYPTDSVLRLARQAGLEDVAFEPVCLAHRVRREPDTDAELYFAAFTSAPFAQFRIDLTPAQPEHAGFGVYEPATLSPILIIGATDGDFAKWWPVPFDPALDCESPLLIQSGPPR
jgi:hypothetical protein